MGGGSLRALSDLGPLASDGDAEAIYMRAVAGAEIYAASVVLDDDALRARLAMALAVPEATLRDHLDAALSSDCLGPFSVGARGARLLLASLDAFVHDPRAMTAMRGPHRDALVAIAIADHPELAPSFVEAPSCDPVPSVEPGDCDWDESSRRTLSALREALGALDRAATARAAGDPLLALLTDRMARARATVLSTILRPHSIGSAPRDPAVVAHGGGELAVLDAIVVVTETEVSVYVSPLAQIDANGGLVWARGGGEPLVVPLPPVLPPVPQAIPELIAAVVGVGLPEGANIGLFPSASLPAHVLVRVDLSLARGHLRPTHLLATGADGAPTSVAFRTVRENDAGEVDARVRILMGGYGVGRGSHGREARIPRVHAASGLSFDVAALQERLGAGRFVESVAMDVMGTMPAAEVLRVAFAAEAPSRSLFLMVP
jgi:hypothetical protein